MTRMTLSRREPWPMRPMRQARPLREPSPPPISMFHSLSRRPRTAASSTPSGMRMQLSWGRLAALGGDQLEAQRGEGGLQGEVVPQVAGVAGLEAFLDHQGEGFLEGVVHGDRGGVVVEAVGAPVALDHGHVEIPALDGGLAGADGLDGAGAEADGGEARGAAQALLGAGVDGVDAPGVDLDGDAGEAGDGVDGDQGSGLVGDAGDLVDGLPDAGGGFGVDDSDHLGGMGLEGLADLVGVEGFAVGAFEDLDLGPGATGDVDHAAAEDAVDADEHVVAGLDQVDDDGFHAGRAGAGDGQGHGVGGLEDVAQEGLHPVHQADEVGVEVAEEGLAHGGQDAGVDLAGAGAEEAAEGEDGFGGCDRGGDGHVRSVLIRGGRDVFHEVADLGEGGVVGGFEPFEEEGLGGCEDRTARSRRRRRDVVVECVAGGHGIDGDEDHGAHAEEVDGGLKDADVGFDADEGDVGEAAAVELFGERGGAAATEGHLGDALGDEAGDGFDACAEPGGVLLGGPVGNGEDAGRADEPGGVCGDEGPLLHLVEQSGLKVDHEQAGSPGCETLLEVHDRVVSSRGRGFRAMLGGWAVGCQAAAVRGARAGLGAFIHVDQGDRRMATSRKPGWPGWGRRSGGVFREFGRDPVKLGAGVRWLIYLSLLDLLFTYVLLRQGHVDFYEANPVARWWFNRWNIQGMTVFKLGVIGLVLVISEVVERRRPGLGRSVVLLGCVAAAGVLFQSLRLMFAHQIAWPWAWGVRG